MPFEKRLHSYLYKILCFVFLSCFLKYTRCSFYAWFFCGISTNWKGMWGYLRSCWKNHCANKVTYRIHLNESLYAMFYSLEVGQLFSLYIIRSLIHLKTNIRIVWDLLYHQKLLGDYLTGFSFINSIWLHRDIFGGTHKVES